MGKKTVRIIGLASCCVAGLAIASSLFNSDTTSLGAGFEYNSECNHITGPFIDIPPFVSNYNYNGQYIIAIQKLEGRNPATIYDCIKYDYPSLVGEYYWIIDKSGHTFYGPLSASEFAMKCKELNVRISFDPKD